MRCICHASASQLLDNRSRFRVFHLNCYTIEMYFCRLDKIKNIQLFQSHVHEFATRKIFKTQFDGFKNWNLNLFIVFLSMSSSSRYRLQAFSPSTIELQPSNYS